jgi:hypothetical protein
MIDVFMWGRLCHLDDLKLELMKKRVNRKMGCRALEQVLYEDF